MELKNALAVCLITFCSATIVVLIARALDIQAAKRLEPRLDRIIEELASLRNGESASPTAIGAARPGVSDPANGLTVYYFHSSTRCPTCESIESQTRAVVQSDFKPYLESGQLHWEVLNYESPAASGLAQEFEIQIPVVVLARRTSGDTTEWKRLDQVWALFDDEPAFASFLRDEIQQMLSSDETGRSASTSAGEVDSGPASASPLAEIPIPEDLVSSETD